MKERLGAHPRGLLGQADTLVGEHRVERSEIRERAVGQGLVGEGPEPLGRLEFGRIGRLQLQVHAGRQVHLRTAVPARLVHDEQDLLGRAGPNLFREVRQRAVKSRNVDCRHEQPVGIPRLRLHEAVDVFPFVPGAHERARAVPPARPDAAQDGLEPYAVFVFRPEFDLGVGVRLLESLHAGGEALGKAA